MDEFQDRLIISDICGVLEKREPRPELLKAIVMALSEFDCDCDLLHMIAHRYGQLQNPQEAAAVAKLFRTTSQAYFALEPERVAGKIAEIRTIFGNTLTIRPAGISKGYELSKKAL